MKLADLNLKFLAAKATLPTADGAGGVMFRCPCGAHDTMIPFSNPLNGPRLPGYEMDGAGWERTGTTAADLTLSPSIRTEGGPMPMVECAHYYVRNGEIIKC